jgi:hypothetical protein
MRRISQPPTDFFAALAVIETACCDGDDSRCCGQVCMGYVVPMARILTRRTTLPAPQEPAQVAPLCRNFRRILASE